MECYLKKTYDEPYYESKHKYDMNDPVLNIIWSRYEFALIEAYDTHYQELVASGDWSQLHDEYRLKYDCDAYYYAKTGLCSANEAIRADTMISFWTPFKVALEKATGWTYYSSATSDKPDRHVKSLFLLIERLEDTEYYNYAKIKEVSDRFSDFARVCCTPGNFILLPDNRMNKEKYACSEDRIDECVHECFPGGKLSSFFGDSESDLAAWIISQKLDILFADKIIEKDKIIPLTPNKFSAYRDMTLERFMSTWDRRNCLFKEETSLFWERMSLVTDNICDG